MDHSRSTACFDRALSVIPGGVNSPVRAFKSVGGRPLFIAQAAGSRVSDVDGHSYIDYVGSWGTAIAGHAHPKVVEAVSQAATKGLSFGAPTEGESDLAEMILGALPAAEKVRFVSSGTEACMSAIRLARAYTGRSKILKFSGCYHGHADMLLVKSGSGIATLGLPDSPGVPQGATNETLVASFNNLDQVRAICADYASDLAAIIVEPIAGNAGFIKPEAGFLEGLRQLCDEVGALLIFDEVMTGFRVGWGGYQVVAGIEPDLTTLGKVIGGGLPLAAYCGRAVIMDHVAPQGSMYQAGTLSGNPLAVAAGKATLEIMSEPGRYDRLGTMTSKLVNGIVSAGTETQVEIVGDSLGGMFGLFFADQSVKNFEEAEQSNTLQFPKYFQHMLDCGIYLAPSPFECGFVSIAHSEEDIDTTVGVARDACMKIAAEGGL